MRLAGGGAFGSLFPGIGALQKSGFPMCELLIKLAACGHSVFCCLGTASCNTYICMYVHIYVHMYVCIYVCMYVSTCVCMHVCMFACCASPDSLSAEVGFAIHIHNQSCLRSPFLFRSMARLPDVNPHRLSRSAWKDGKAADKTEKCFLHLSRSQQGKISPASQRRA